MPVGAIAGAALGGLSGALANQKEGGTQANNYYSGYLDPRQAQRDVNAADTATINANVGDATQRVQSNPLYNGLFGQGGQLSQAESEATNLANRGFSLKPEDYEAYGQASGNVARMFGQNEQSLAQSLANRGLSGSNVAAAQFSGLQGNKNEQLAGLQRQIANDRMNMNLQRLGQTRNFLSQLGQQAQGAISQDVNSNLARGQQEYEMGMGQLGKMQDQANQGLQQQQQTQHSSGLSNALGGIMGGGLAGAKLGMGGMSGGSSGGMS